jgi:hypothetical protein
LLNLQTPLASPCFCVTPDTCPDHGIVRVSFNTPDLSSLAFLLLPQLMSLARTTHSRPSKSLTLSVASKVYVAAWCIAKHIHSQASTQVCPSWQNPSAPPIQHTNMTMLFPIASHSAACLQFLHVQVNNFLGNLGRRSRNSSRQEGRTSGRRAAAHRRQRRWSRDSRSLK